MIVCFLGTIMQWVAVFVVFYIPFALCFYNVVDHGTKDESVEDFQDFGHAMVTCFFMLLEGSAKAIPPS